VIKEVYDFSMMTSDSNASLNKFALAIKNMKQREKVEKPILRFLNLQLQLQRCSRLERFYIVGKIFLL
jgi:hypothetical protein